MEKITVEVADLTKISDGYHTFSELYDHRSALFIALMISNPLISWKSKQHDDGSSMPGWFIAGINLSSGAITYHLPDSLWDSIDGITTLIRAPYWDGHTSDTVIERLYEWVREITKNGVKNEGKIE